MEIVPVSVNDPAQVYTGARGNCGTGGSGSVFDWKLLKALFKK